MFSRHLYLTQDVQNCFIHCLLNSDKEQEDELYFWFKELYDETTDHAMWNLVYRIYYDFYAVTNPLYENYLYKIHKSSDKQRAPGEKYLWKAIQSLKNLITTDMVFKMRIMKVDRNYISKESKQFKKLKDKMRLAIQTKNYHDIRYIIDCYKKPINLYRDIKKAFIMINNDDLNNDIKLKKQEKLFEKYKYENKKHACMALVAYLICPPEYIWDNENNMFISHPTRDLSLNDLEELDEIDEEEVMNDIVSEMQSLDVSCNNVMKDDIRNATLYHVYPIINILCEPGEKPIYEFGNGKWIYYARTSKYWKNAIQDMNGIVNHEDKTVTFKRLLDEVEFCANYDYDLEEVSSDIQNKLFGYDLAKTGDELSLLAWLNSINNMLHLNSESVNKNIPNQCKYN